MLSPADVLGFKIHGPTPIPGYLFPHPGTHPTSPPKNTHNQTFHILE